MSISAALCAVDFYRIIYSNPDVRFPHVAYATACATTPYWGDCIENRVNPLFCRKGDNVANKFAWHGRQQRRSVTPLVWHQNCMGLFVW